MIMLIQANGSCPMGCGEHLVFSTDQKQLVCQHPDCPDNECVSRVLALCDLTEHLVNVTYDGWTVQHPIKERARNELFACGVHGVIKFMLDNGVYSTGLYQLSDTTGRLTRVGKEQ